MLFRETISVDFESYMKHADTACGKIQNLILDIKICVRGNHCDLNFKGWPDRITIEGS